jgi:hypothetical protein
MDEPKLPDSIDLVKALRDLPELAPVEVIRTETVLSRLPIHNLSKSGKIDIGILRKNEQGRVELQWEVSYSAKYGQARQLAYQVDTLVVNRRIDEEGRPVPRILRLGTLTEVCRFLDLPPSGKNIGNIKKAILQNAGSLITAKLTYRSVAGLEKRLEAVFTRYSVVFTGEVLPDGRQADGVYLIFNEPFWEVLNSAPLRPLDYGYLKQLGPAPQRFYEILSYRIFAALKYKHRYAKLSYSDYCTYSAQTRYYDYEHFKKQMYKVHRPHLAAGYITKVNYQSAEDAEGRPDWIMYYEPGPKAQAEFAVFESRPQLAQQALLEEAEQILPESSGAQASRDLVFQELVARGISPTRARRILALGRDPERILEQLAWGDHLIQEAGSGRFYNPPGFYVHLIRQDITPPAGFAAKRADQAADSSIRGATPCDLERKRAYEAYVEQQREAYAKLPENWAEYQTLVERKKSELVNQYRSLALSPKETLQGLAEQAAMAELGRRAPVPSFEEFLRLNPSPAGAA